MKSIFKSVLIALILLAFETHSISQEYIVKRGERPTIDLNKVSSEAYEKNQIQIKFKPSAEKSLELFRLRRDKTQSSVIGIEEVDKLNQQFDVRNIEPLFKESAMVSAFNNRHRAWGFHLWLRLNIEETENIVEVVKAYQALDVVEHAEPVYKKQLIAPVSRSPYQPSDDPKEIKWTPNDPRYNEQWHYHNTGQQSGTIDKDIDLPEAWEIETGSSDVIVAVVDGGIQINHPDIAANMWSGIGYNFVDNTTVIEADEHGTHVAGTVAAVNNNGVGVSGIAGGSGSGDGVRLMTCQVFTNSGADGFHLAPVYAADNGAALSQNSWGYTSAGVFEQSVLDAIDYFNTNGGGNALDGGITIFAAGNDGTSGAWYPGYYSGTFSVAATNNNDQKAWYSNYDTWVDISAPGGETNSVNARGVLSTLSGNSYAFYQGTSMACPHVSGVAALVISLAYGQLSNNDVIDILQNTTDDHYPQNPTYIGKLGAGRLNAYQALLETQNYISGVLNPRSFTATGTGINSISLEWTKNNDNNDVLILWSADGSFGNLMDGTNYTVGQVIAGGGTVLYKGNALLYNHTGLNANTQYFYKAFSYDGTNSYSSGRVSNAWTDCDILATLPYLQDFNATGGLPNCWSMQDNQGNGQVWAFGTITNGLTGTTGNYAYLNSDGFGSGNSQNADLLSPIFDLSAYMNVEIQFNHYFRSYTNSVASFHYSIDGGVNWVMVDSWTASTPNPSAYNMVISELTGQSNVQFKWNYIGTWGYYWCVDDILIFGDSNIPGAPTAAFNPSPANNAASILLNGNLSWTWGNNTTAYDVWFGTSGNMQLIVSQGVAGNSGTTGTYTYNSLQPNTNYQWQIISYNTALGLSVSSSIWNFSTACGVFTLPFAEGFEDDSPGRDCWAQEYVSGNKAWTFAAGSSGGTITSAHGGLRNARFTGSSGGPYITKLISPILDLSGMMNVELSFWYGQQDWAGDQNTLKLFYRTSPTSAWVQIGNTYNQNISVWTQVEGVALPNPSATYQIAFEGTDNFGYANVVDDISIDGLPIGPYADFTANPLIGMVGETITFTDASGNGTFSSWEWNFGEGANPSTASGQGPHQVIYSTVGSKTISLSVDGTYVKTKANYVTINENNLPVPRELQGSLVSGTNVALSWLEPLMSQGFSDDFEAHTNFSLDFGEYTFIDNDGSPTYGFTGITFPNSYYTGSYIVFNPYQTSPAMTNSAIFPHSGDKFAACFAATNPPNNDWMITPSITVGSGDMLKFWAKSYVADYGLERFKVGISTTGTNPADFTIISAGSYVQAPVTWTQYTYDLSAYSGQNIYIGIQCVSNDAFIFMLDDLEVGNDKGTISLQMDFETTTESNVAQIQREKGVHVPIEIINNQIKSKQLSGYQIVRNDMVIGTTSNLNYLDINPGYGDFTYTVKAVYTNPNGVSAPSNPYYISIQQNQCNAPSLLYASNISSSAADLYWTAGGSENNWTLAYGAAGFNPDTEGILIENITSIPYSVYALNPNTAYDFYVKAVCSQNISSTWSSTGSFITERSLPVVFNFTGGGTYCENISPTGVHAVLSNSETDASYQLIKNSIAITNPVTGTGSALTWENLDWGNYQVLASNNAGTTLMNGVVVVEEIPLSQPTITISASATQVCSGTEVVLSAEVAHQGDNPSYQWYVNDQAIGNNSPVFTYTPANGDEVYSILTSSASCVTNSQALSNTITFNVETPLTPTVQISVGENNVCNGTSVTFSATSSNSGVNPVFQWKVNGINAGTNSESFSYVPQNGDVVYTEMSSSLGCVTSTTVSSNQIVMEVQPALTVYASINADSNPVCEGTSVTFSSFVENGGSNPTYQWYKNGIPTGSNNPSYSYTPANGDMVDLVVNSNLSCTANNPATSNMITMSVLQNEPALVSISVDNNPVCEGQNVVLTAAAINGGANPSYLWKLNGQDFASNSPSISFMPNQGDQIQVIMTSSASCVYNNPAASNTVTIQVNQVDFNLSASPAESGNVQFTGDIAFGQTIQIEANPNPGWNFEHWIDGNGLVFAETPQATVSIDACYIDLTAIFTSGTHLTGKLLYYNPVESFIPLENDQSNIALQLFDGDSPVSNVLLLDNQIPFSFNNLEAGQQLKLRLWEECNDNLIEHSWSWNNWGGITALDALIVSYMTVQNPIVASFPWILPTPASEFSEFFRNTADANNSGNLTALDALTMMFRSVGQLGNNPFPGGKHNFQIAGTKLLSASSMTYPSAPDKVFTMHGNYAAGSPANSIYHEVELPVIEMGANYFNIFMVATGDMNASYVPGQTLKQSLSMLEKGEIELVPGEMIQLPLYLESEQYISAISLHFKFNPAMIQLVRFKDIEIQHIDNENGTASMAWFDRNPRSVTSETPLVVIDAILLTNEIQTTPLLELKSESEIADGDAMVIKDLSISYPKLKINDHIGEPLSVTHQAYPNPFNQSSLIEFNIAESGQVKVCISNLLGMQIKCIDQGMLEAGTYKIIIDDQLTPERGTYLYQIQYTGDRSETVHGKLVKVSR